MTSQPNPTPSSVIATLRENYDPDIEDRLLNIYQLGSRVYGTATADSDWDFMVVVTHLTKIQEDHFLWECYDDGFINCALYSVDYFQLMVWEHRMETIETLFLAPKHRWLEKVTFKLELDKDILRASVSWISRLRWSMGKRRFASEPYKSRKCLFHGIRYLIFAHQVLQHGRITDYGAANGLLAQIMGTPGTTFSEIAAVWEPQFNKLVKDLNEAADPNEFYARWEVEPYMKIHLQHPSAEVSVSNTQKSNANSPLAIVNFLNSHTQTQAQQELQRLHFRLEAHPKFPNLIHLRPTIKSPPEHRFSQECYNGLTLDSADSWCVVAFSFCQVHQFSCKSNSFALPLHQVMKLPSKRHLTPAKHPQGETLDIHNCSVSNNENNLSVSNNNNSNNEKDQRHSTLDKKENQCEEKTVLSGDLKIEDFFSSPNCLPRVYEKIDGTSVILYHYRDSWELASKYEPAGSIPLAWRKKNSKQYSIASIFWRIWKSRNYPLPQEKDM